MPNSSILKYSNINLSGVHTHNIKTFDFISLSLYNIKYFSEYFPRFMGELSNSQLQKVFHCSIRGVVLFFNYLQYLSLLRTLYLGEAGINTFLTAVKELKQFWGVSFLYYKQSSHLRGCIIPNG